MSKRTRKPPIYCRPHGRRIIIVINSIGGCRKCVDDLTKKVKERLNDETTGTGTNVRSPE